MFILILILSQCSIKYWNLIKIFGINWIKKNFHGFCIFVLSYKAKTKTWNWQNFWKRSIQHEAKCLGQLSLHWDWLWSHLSLKILRKFEEEEICSSIEGGYYKNHGTCLVLTKKHLSGIHSKFLKSNLVPRAIISLENLLKHVE